MHGSVSVKQGGFNFSGDGWAVAGCSAGKYLCILPELMVRGCGSMVFGTQCLRMDCRQLFSSGTHADPVVDGIIHTAPFGARPGTTTGARRSGLFSRGGSCGSRWLPFKQPAPPNCSNGRPPKTPGPQVGSLNVASRLSRGASTQRCAPEMPESLRRYRS